MIVLGHCLTFASITLPNWLGGGVIHTFAYAGVDIFFVISGIVVSSAAQKSALRSTQKLPFKEFFYFAIKRIMRIYPIYWVVFFSVCLLAPLLNVKLENIANSVFISTIFLLEKNNSVIPQAWTLVFEGYFYFSLAIVILLFHRHFYKGIAAWMALSLLVSSIFIAKGISHYVFTDPLILEFGFGCFIQYLTFKKIRKALLLTLIVGVVFFLFGAYQTFQTGLLSPMPRMLSFGIGSALILYSLINFELISSIKAPAFSVYLGNISYSIYLWHEVVIGLLLYISVSHANFHLTHPLIFVALTICLVLIISSLSYRLIERPFIKLGNHFIQKLNDIFSGVDNVQLVMKKLSASVVVLSLLAIFLLYRFSQPDKLHLTLPGNDLPSQTGRVQGLVRVAVAGVDKPGFITFGPYIPLPKGTYQLRLKYSSTAPVEQIIGKADIFDADKATMHTDYPLYGTAGIAKVIQTSFAVTEGRSHRFEFRNNWNGLAEIQIISIALRRE